LTLRLPTPLKAAVVHTQEPLIDARKMETPHDLAVISLADAVASVAVDFIGHAS
jgi:hypothetical protein